MSGKEQTKKNGEQGGVLDSVKEAGKGISNEISKKTGGSQVRLLADSSPKSSSLRIMLFIFRSGTLCKRKIRAARNGWQKNRLQLQQFHSK